MSKLLARAKVNLENAKNSYSKMGVDNAYVDDCCYNLQQVIEKTLRYIVEINGSRYAENHDIRANLNILNQLGVNCSEEKDLCQLASTLCEWKTSARYRDNFVATKADIDEAMRISESLISYAETLCLGAELKQMKNFDV